MVFYVGIGIFAPLRTGQRAIDCLTYDMNMTMKRYSLKFSSWLEARNLALALMIPLVMSSCVSYDSWSRTTTGMSLGAFFGSTVGGLIGGYRGSDIGTIVGGAAGAAIGAASAEKNAQQREQYSERDYRDYQSGRYGNENRRYDNEPVGYGRYNNGSDVYASFNGIEISHLTFSDYNGDRALQPGERAQITFDLYNNSGRTLYSIAPVVSCDYKRVNVSPTAIIGELPAGRAVRYQAEVVARSNARNRELLFQIALPDAHGRLYPIKTFSIELFKRR